ncbi:PEP-CTERM sorting domain-containing protein [Rugamonas sp. CCM 8940]|uniref:PEP-CTERM sorting domain-containing protein n=1 Tax=Rugamonas sp. CCM 8940 TaxID=2765359 RepID=UPI0018F34F51|nr:PEP-CTERM sorting domain-containing protein [Rugamonas sp. CCM 8940]MBJ7314221.1 PEP-CTERM sorting domain-containing protein [Rugamonas sp. CCM 8940]
MKKLFCAALITASFASAAQAEVYNFSYTFGGNGLVIDGSMNGDLHGDLLDNISDVKVNFNGHAFTGTLYQAAWNEQTSNWDNSLGAVVSTDAAKNNFLFVDTKDPTRFSNNYFYFTNNNSIGSEVFAVSYSRGDIGWDNPANPHGNWTLTAAPVPEPAEGAMLLAGLGLMGVLARRRRQA